MTHSSHQHIVKQTAVFFPHVDRHLCGLFRSEVAQVNVGLQLGFNKKKIISRSMAINVLAVSLPKKLTCTNKHGNIESNNDEDDDIGNL